MHPEIVSSDYFMIRIFRTKEKKNQVAQTIMIYEGYHVRSIRKAENELSLKMHGDKV